MNSVNIIGRLTKDPEMKFGSSGVAICRFTLAVEREYKKQGEERTADFIMCVCFSKSAEFVSKYFQKGIRVGATGRIQTNKFEKDDGSTQYFTEVVTRSHFFADGKRDSVSDANDSGQSTAQKTDEFYPVADDDDELPF